MVFCGESIITEISVYVFFYMSEFIIQSTHLMDRRYLRSLDFLNNPIFIHQNAELDRK